MHDIQLETSVLIVRNRTGKEEIGLVTPTPWLYISVAMQQPIREDVGYVTPSIIA